jgi:hypothetical protein
VISKRLLYEINFRRPLARGGRRRAKVNKKPKVIIITLGDGKMMCPMAPGLDNIQFLEKLSFVFLAARSIQNYY